MLAYVEILATCSRDQNLSSALFHRWKSIDEIFQYCMAHLPLGKMGQHSKTPDVGNTEQQKHLWYSGAYGCTGAGAYKTFVWFIDISFVHFSSLLPTQSCLVSMQKFLSFILIIKLLWGEKRWRGGGHLLILLFCSLYIHQPKVHLLIYVADKEGAAGMIH